MSLLLLIPAAGKGARLGRHEPKALLPVGGLPLLAWCLRTFAAAPFERGVVVVPPEREDLFESVVRGRCRIVSGGDTRARSVRRGVEALAPGAADFVVIHDAARPFVTVDEVGAVLGAAEATGAAIAVLPIPDTVKRVEADLVRETLDRNLLALAATPQIFRGDVLLRALESGDGATDEATLCERMGQPVAAVPVSRRCFKITYPEDLEMAEALAATLAANGQRRSPKGENRQ